MCAPSSMHTSYKVCYSSVSALACWHETQEGILDSGRVTALTVTATEPRGRSFCVCPQSMSLATFLWLKQAFLSLCLSHCF